ncbi:hypothetical protein PV325_003607 [Microctonus aethiopoides]|nr:hypothetical protein PV325_003607 [Microctonus aethiopoides]
MLDLKSSGTTAAELPRTTAFTNLSMLFADASSSYKGGWSHATSPAPGQVLTRHRTRKTCVQEGELKEEEEEEEEKEVVKEVGRLYSKKIFVKVYSKFQSIDLKADFVSIFNTRIYVEAEE